MELSEAERSARVAKWREQHCLDLKESPKPDSPGLTSPDDGQPKEKGAICISKWDGASYRKKLNKNEDEYGTPMAGSKTDKRGLKAGRDISKEVIELCEVFIKSGHVVPDGTFAMRFGPLFKLYTRISDKVVGMLLIARRHGLIKFKGEMLYQKQDDDVVIYLIRVPAQLAQDANDRIAGKSFM